MSLISAPPASLKRVKFSTMSSKRLCSQVPRIMVSSTTVVTKWKRRDDVESDSDEQWPDGYGGKRTSRGGRSEEPNEDRSAPLVPATVADHLECAGGTTQGGGDCPA